MSTPSDTTQEVSCSCDPTTGKMFYGIESPYNSTITIDTLRNIIESDSLLMTEQIKKLAQKKLIKILKSL